eukprot:CAMPEP_0113629170 /NCGR_PEP_ID=MMETSP0017_2-20120614/15139_1 /TAXON_ID=2856 /ORGANISM="Cylindrotheca closterium" /LENGTH=825 /DNA_ID=CAMNT_0000539551 /DNA_START=57 /DNA_END=2531 /DNA_ORIENTATION=- /assembly_acc=CAM_ASM_000147
MFKKFMSQDVSTSQTNNDTGWKSGWGLNSRPQQQGLLSGRQSPQVVQEKTGFLGGLSAGFLTQTSTQQHGNGGTEDEYERKMRGKRRLDDLEWFAEYLKEKNPGDLDEDEQYGSLLMGLHTGGAKLDTKEFNELKQLAGKTRQREELKEQERSKPRQRKRAEDLTEEELMEIEIFNKQREDAEVDEYLELLAMKENGEEVDSVRLKILDLLDKRNCDEALSGYGNPFGWIEMKFLVSLKQDGKKFDEDRLRELELLQLQQQNVELSDEELDELDWFDSKRLREEQCLEELIVIREKQAAGEEVDEDHLKFLNLLNRKLEGELLEDAEVDEIVHHQKQWKEEDGMQESIAEEKPNHEEQATNETPAVDQIQAEDVENHALSPKSGKTNTTLESQDLRHIGLPPTIEVSSVSSFDHSVASIGGLSGGSYVEDLMAQRNFRYEEREEQTFDEALDVYEAKLRQTNQRENEQLFSQIYQEMQVKSSKKHEHEDSIADERLKEAANAYEVQRKKLKEERSAFRAQQQEFASSLEEERDKAEQDESLSIIGTGTLQAQPESTSKAPIAHSPSSPAMTTPNRSNDTPDLNKTQADEDANRKDLDDLLDRLHKGEKIDEDRLYELELFERYRLGESLTNEELEDLHNLEKEREKERHHIDSDVHHRTTNKPAKQASEGSGAVKGSPSVNDVTPVTVESEEIDRTQENGRMMDSNQVMTLEISNEGNDDQTDSKKDFNDSNNAQKNNADSEELQDLLGRFERGEDIDEERLYELLERHRISVEREDLEVLVQGRDEENKSSSQHSKPSNVGDVPSIPEESSATSASRTAVLEPA